MLFALVFVGVPYGQIHAHEGGNNDHDHGFAASERTQVSIPDSSVQQDSSSDSSGATVLHMHDSVVTPPPPLPVHPLDIAPFAFPDQEKLTLAYMSRPSATPLPPYRPPIV